MLNKLSAILYITKNLKNIKGILNKTYVAVVKLHSTLVFIESQTNDTKLGKVLSDYLPKSIETISTIKSIFEKYGAFIDLDVSALAQSSCISEKTLVEELEVSIKELNDILS